LTYDIYGGVMRVVLDDTHDQAVFAHLPDHALHKGGLARSRPCDDRDERNITYLGETVLQIHVKPPPRALGMHVTRRSAPSSCSSCSYSTMQLPVSRSA